MLQLSAASPESPAPNTTKAFQEKLPCPAGAEAVWEIAQKG